MKTFRHLATDGFVKSTVWVMVLLFVQAAAAQNVSSTLYATGNKGTELLTIDLLTQRVNLIGPTGYPFSFALTFSPSGTAYTITNLFNSSLAQLATVNLQSGAATLVGQPLGLNLMIMGLTVSPQGVLYAGAMPATSIYGINTSTGIPTFIGASGTTGELMSFAYDPQGMLYAASPTELYTADLTTGTATPVAALSVGGVMGIAIDDSGTLYATNFVGCPPCSSVYRIDPMTGTATLLFNTKTPFIHNIVFAPGTPAQQFIGLEGRINTLPLAGATRAILDGQLAGGLGAINSGDFATACGILGQFQDDVNALAETIPAVGVQQLMFANTRLETALACR